MLIGGALIIVAVALVVWRRGAPATERSCVYDVCPGSCSRPRPGPGCLSRRFA